MAKKISPSEVHAYVYIFYELVNKKGWAKKEIYTQQECLSIKLIAEKLGNTHPENIVKINESTYYVIEAKNEREKLEIALKEAKECYADLINSNTLIKAPFVTGIAGNNEVGFIAKSQYFKDGEWETITENEAEITGLLSKNQIQRILDLNNPHLKDLEINEAEFLKTAEEINGYLHEGGINKDYRARVMSAILLAFVEGTKIDLDAEPSVLIGSINSRAALVLQKKKKVEFAKFVSIDLPASTDNHVKFTKAIVKTIQELLGLNIRSAMQSGKDVLGTFYEVFLKYGNGAKEIGIVLTPRHITKFTAEALDIQANDLVLDPTCGTGGFLVAALDEVKKKSSSDDFDTFINYGLYGIEEQDAVISLALVNMIFRGDGRNNMTDGNRFAKWLNVKQRNGQIKAEYLSEDNEKRIPPITKVMMNPPFPKKKTDYKEFLFIEQALKQMQDGCTLFSVLPYSCMIKSGKYKKWRERLLKENTLLSVVTFPEDLFYPVGVHTLGIFVKKGVPHPLKQNVLWIRALNDGRWKKKGKRLEHPKANNDYPIILPTLQQFIKNQDAQIKSIPAFQRVCPIDFTITGEDKNKNELELVPEVYLEENPITPNELRDGVEQIIRDQLSFRIKYENRIRDIDETQ
ncbi:MAG: HsdM family class I SAM-dependent methyltransferase [Dehalococcoidales bacterium]